MREIQTQGIKYAGSKKVLIPRILSLVEKTGARSVWDAFSGTTRVSQALAQCGFTTISSDLALWSEVFGTCWLLNTQEPEKSGAIPHFPVYEELITHLNHVQPVEGWFSEHYGGDPNTFSESLDGEKKPFQRKNMQKLDGIRAEIDALNLEPISKAVTLTSLILALDRVDSTLGHFSSYLRQWSPRSYNDLKLEVPHLWKNEMQNSVFREDIFKLTPKVTADLVYFDPPYGSNNEKMPPSRVRYSAYYHFWTTLIANDRPELFGKAFRRADSSDLQSASVFEEFRKNEKTGRFLAVEALERLLREVQTHWILLSYSSGGRATAEELLDVVHSVGTLRELVKIDYRRNVMAQMKWTDEWLREEPSKNQEFLILIEK